MSEFKNFVFHPDFQREIAHIDRNKPLQINYRDEWVDCEVGKCYACKVGVYFGEEQHLWISFNGGSYIRNKPVEFAGDLYIMLCSDGVIRTASKDRYDQISTASLKMGITHQLRIEKFNWTF